MYATIDSCFNHLFSLVAVFPLPQCSTQILGLIAHLLKQLHFHYINVAYIGCVLVCFHLCLYFSYQVRKEKMITVGLSAGVLASPPPSWTMTQGRNLATTPKTQIFSFSWSLLFEEVTWFISWSFIHFLVICSFTLCLRPHSYAHSPSA